MQHCDGLALFDFSHSLVDRMPAWCLGFYGWKPDWDSKSFLGILPACDMTISTSFWS